MKRTAGSTIWTGSTCLPRNPSMRSRANACTCSSRVTLRRAGFQRRTCRTMVEASLARIDKRLEVEIEKSLRFAQDPDPAAPSARPWRWRPSAAFPDLRKAIRTDVEAAYQRRPGRPQLRGDHPRLSLRPRDLAPAVCPRPLRARRAAAAADDHRVRARAHRDRHPSRARRSAPISSSTTARGS